MMTRDEPNSSVESMVGDMIASTLHWAAAKLGREAALDAVRLGIAQLPASSRAANGSEPMPGSASRSNAAMRSGTRRPVSAAQS
jgi:hypothetical protein